MFDTKYNLIILCTSFIVSLVVWICYFATVPGEVEVAARVDEGGGGEARCRVLVCGSGWSSWSSCW